MVKLRGGIDFATSYVSNCFYLFFSRFDVYNLSKKKKSRDKRIKKFINFYLLLFNCNLKFVCILASFWRYFYLASLNSIVASGGVFYKIYSNLKKGALKLYEFICNVLFQCAIDAFKSMLLSISVCVCKHFVNTFQNILFANVFPASTCILGKT